MELIHAYTREQAIEDGELVDVSEMAREANFTVPVALTGALHRTLEDTAETSEDYTGRLWDVLSVLYATIRRGVGESDSELIRVKVGGKHLKLFTVCGPDDDLKPCITIGYPEDF